jgi:hypothetical protein
MTDEQLMGKDLKGSGDGLVYVVFHVFLNGLNRRVSRWRCKLGLQLQKVTEGHDYTKLQVKLSCTTK